jgi:hypothetical protein
MDLCQAFSTFGTSAGTDTPSLPSKPTTYNSDGGHHNDGIHHFLSSSLKLSSGKVSVVVSWLDAWCSLFLGGLVRASHALAALFKSAVNVGLVRPPPEPPPSLSNICPVGDYEDSYDISWDAWTFVDTTLGYYFVAYGLSEGYPWSTTVSLVVFGFVFSFPLGARFPIHPLLASLAVP